MFLIEGTSRYSFEAAENTSYVRQWDIMNDNRRIIKKELLEAVRRFYIGGKVPYEIAKQIIGFFDIMQRDTDGKLVYMYNDVELLRLVYTHISMTREDEED